LAGGFEHEIGAIPAKGGRVRLTQTWGAFLRMIW
jgi:hypothetical protein